MKYQLYETLQGTCRIAELRADGLHVCASSLVSADTARGLLCEELEIETWSVDCLVVAAEHAEYRSPQAHIVVYAAEPLQELKDTAARAARWLREQK